MASAASGDASPRAFMSFLDSKNIEPLESGFIIGEIKSVFKNLSFGMLALLSHSRISPQICALMLPYIAGLRDFQPKLTPLILYRCSFSRSTIPAPNPPSSMNTIAGFHSSIASITCPTTVMVSSPLCRMIFTMSRPWRTASTVASAPNRAGSTPITIGADGSLYFSRFIASSTTKLEIN